MQSSVTRFVNDGVMASATGTRPGGIGGIYDPLADPFEFYYSDPDFSSYNAPSVLDSIYDDGDMVTLSSGMDNPSVAGDFSFFDEILSAAPGILQVWQQYQAGENLNDINEARAQYGQLPITSAQLNSVSNYAAQNPQRFMQYTTGSSGFDLQGMLPILLIGGIGLLAFFMLNKK